MGTMMNAGSDNQALEKFLRGEKLATSEEASEIERVVRLMSFEASTIGEGGPNRARRGIWPWRRARAAG
jgi:hypothetical protein